MNRRRVNSLSAEMSAESLVLFRVVLAVEASPWCWPTRKLKGEPVRLDASVRKRKRKREPNCVELTSDFDAVVVDVDAVLAALLRRESDGVDALLHLADAVRHGAAAVDQVELGLAPSGLRRVASEREFLSWDGAAQVQQLKRFFFFFPNCLV